MHRPIVYHSVKLLSSHSAAVLTHAVTQILQFVVFVAARRGLYK